MDTRAERYHILFEKLVGTMTNFQGVDLGTIYGTLSELCKMFRISKGVTYFYNSLKHEKIGRGETFVCYDEGKPCKEVDSIRIVTDAMTVAITKIYMTKDSEPLTDWEKDCCELIMRTILTYISRNRAQRMLEKQSFYDDDGYRNLRFFIRYLQHLNNQGALSGRSAMNFNIRHFSLVNQEIGRSNGDLVMRSYIKGLENIINDDGVVCRMGGDNFVALCRQYQLDRVISYLREAPVNIDNHNVKRIMISSSVGVFNIPDDFRMDDPGDILDKLFTTRQLARQSDDHIIFYSEQLGERREKLIQLQHVFPEAIAAEEFKVFYQPKIDVVTGQLCGAEALCRWFRDGQIIPPQEFIPELERSSEICTLDFYMLDHVCRDIRRWMDEGRQVIRVSVNLSRKHMMDIDLMETIIGIIDRNNVPHRYIEIELTETTTDVEFRDLKRVVSGLQQAGIYTSIDDFGIGYSSLNLLREVPWNVLKVDKSFLPVDAESEDSTRGIMFKYVVAMSKELGLECIAEGVETHEQLNILKKNNCPIAQGFYFDRPLPVDRFEEKLDKHRYNVE